ncbi:MAG TPA: M28 family peptidase [Armatimonadota bacterium]
MNICRKILLLAVIAGVLPVLLGAQCSGNAAATQQAAPYLFPFDKDHAWADLKQQVAFGYRIPGTEAHRTTCAWLVEQLHQSAAVVAKQEFTHKLGGREVHMWNIIATLPGAGEGPHERVVLVAHWDTRPTADQDPNPENRKKPIQGASDGASGVAVLLEIARQLKAHPISRDVVILLVDGEDYGPGVEDMLLGAKYYAAHLPAKKPDWGVLLDMVGDKDLDIYREPNSDRLAKPVNDRLFRAAREMGYLRVAGNPGFIDAPYKYEITDDHIPFNNAGVPMADLIDFNYPAWHTLADTPDQCSADSLNVVGKTILYALQLP